MHEFSNTTQKALSESGWQANRKIDIQSFRLDLAKKGYPWSEKVESFLQTFGGLNVKVPRRDGSPDFFHFDPSRAVQDIDARWIKDYSKRLRNIDLCVVGQAFSSHMTLWSIYQLHIDSNPRLFYMTGNFLEILDQFFVRHEFTKNKQIWYQRKNDGFIVFQFQKFKYDPTGSGFINFGVVFNMQQKNVKKPRGEDTWDLRGRVPRFGTNPLADGLFKLEVGDFEKQEVDSILAGIEREIIPFLEHYSQLSSLVDDLKNKKFDFSKALTRIVP